MNAARLGLARQKGELLDDTALAGDRLGGKPKLPQEGLKAGLAHGDLIVCLAHEGRKLLDPTAGKNGRGLVGNCYGVQLLESEEKRSHVRRVVNHPDTPLHSSDGLGRLQKGGHERVSLVQNSE